LQIWKNRAFFNIAFSCHILTSGKSLSDIIIEFNAFPAIDPYAFSFPSISDSCSFLLSASSSSSRYPFSDLNTFSS
jgi:hypothetical protein